MASYTLSLTGKSSELEANYYPSIELNSDDDYVCGLVDFQSFMTIPNITSENNRFYYLAKCEVKLESQKYYTIDEILQQFHTQIKHSHPSTVEKFINTISNILSKNDSITKVNTDNDLNKIYNSFYELADENMKTELNDIKNINHQIKLATENMSVELLNDFKLGEVKCFYNSKIGHTFPFECIEYIEIPTGSYEVSKIEEQVNYLLENILQDFKFIVRTNTNTMKCEIKCTHQLFCIGEHNVLVDIFGFENYRILESNVKHESDLTVQISKVNALKIDCNIVTGSYSNGNPGHTLHEFYPTVEMGYKIVEVPTNVIYLPVTTRSISNISIRIVDQDGHLVDFRGENITLRLHIKKL